MANKYSFGDYLDEVERIVSENENLRPHERLGQTYFNVLNYYNVELAGEILGTEYDCFYEDNRIDAFLDYLIERW